jgi:hypothetical protein
MLIPLVLVVCLNLPPWVRYLPGFVVLLGVIPGPSCNNFQTFLKYIAQQFDSVFVNPLACFDRNQLKWVRGLQLNLSAALIALVMQTDFRLLGCDFVPVRLRARATYSCG